MQNAIEMQRMHAWELHPLLVLETQLEETTFMSCFYCTKTKTCFRDHKRNSIIHNTA